MTNLALDERGSRLRIHTYAEGLLARLAHDLALEHAALRGTGTRTADGGTAEIEVPLSGFVVLGVLHGERLDETALSPSDRRDVLEKMRREVFHASEGALLRARAELSGGAAKITVTPPAGRAVTVATRPTLSDEEGGGVRARGAVDLSLAALGSDPVKGPMGAFKVKDRIEVRFDLVFRAPQPA